MGYTSEQYEICYHNLIGWTGSIGGGKNHCGPGSTTGKISAVNLF